MTMRVRGHEKIIILIMHQRPPFFHLARTWEQINEVAMPGYGHQSIFDAIEKIKDG